MKCIIILCYNPNKILTDFLKELYHYFKKRNLEYSIFLTIDNNEKKYKSPKEYQIIQMDDKIATKAGFKDSYLRYYHRKDAKVKSMALDKSLYYFSKYNNFDDYWFLEEDVFIPSVKTIPYLDKKYEKGDLLVSGYSEKKDDNFDWHWPLMVRNNRNKSRKKRLEKASESKDYYFEKPWYNSWCPVMRISSELLNEVKKFAKENKTLTFMEFFFATLAKKNNLEIVEVKEFKLRLEYPRDKKSLFKFNEISWKNLYSQIKDQETQKEFRKKKNY